MENSIVLVHVWRQLKDRIFKKKKKVNQKLRAVICYYYVKYIFVSGANKCFTVLQVTVVLSVVFIGNIYSHFKTSSFVFFVFSVLKS